MSLLNHHLDQKQLHSGDRVWIFLGIHTPLGKFVYQHAIKAVQVSPGVMLDLYFVGNHITQKQIQSWAIAVGIPRALVNHEVTLNYGNRRFTSVTKDEKANLPFIGVVHNGHFQPIKLSSVL